MIDVDSNIKEFWETKHKIGDVAALSGCFYDETIDFLRLRDYISPGVSVLEVGVGLGYVTKGLFNAGVLVSALDISDLSLEKVRGWCVSTFNISDLTTLPFNHFDAIICNNVVQHVPTDFLVKELEALFNSLKSTGVLALEFVSNDKFDDNGVSPSLSNIQNGGLCRTPKFIGDIINMLGGISTIVFDKKVDLGIVQGHHVVHITKQCL